MPVTSTIQTQCTVAPGTARAQKRHGGDGISIVTFGDAGTAEGDFHVMLNWATQPGWELPLLMICTNNSYGISTSYEQVHGQDRILDIAMGYGVKGAHINGTDVYESYQALEEAITFCRTERKPYFLEATVTRLHGHSSSSGANRVPEGTEIDPLYEYRDTLIKEGLITQEDYDSKYDEQTQRMRILLDEVKQEPAPKGSSIYDNVFAEA